MPSPRKPDKGRRALSWLLPAALFALAPKCLLCVLAYAGLATALGLGGPELCGATDTSPIPWSAALGWLGACGGLIALGLHTRSRSRRSARHREAAEKRKDAIGIVTHAGEQLGFRSQRTSIGRNHFF